MVGFGLWLPRLQGGVRRAHFLPHLRFLCCCSSSPLSLFLFLFLHSPYNFLRAAFFLSAPLMPLPVFLFPVVASWEAGSVFRCKSGKCCGWECCTGADLFEGHHSHSLFQCKTLLSLTVSLLHLMFSGLGKKLAWK